MTKTNKIIGWDKLEDWERDEINLHLKRYEDGEYRKLLTHYCHEGLYVDRQGQGYLAYICSQEAKGKTQEEAIENLAKLVIESMLKYGCYGC